MLTKLTTMGTVVLACACLAAAAPGDAKNSTIMLTLENGVAPPVDNQREGRNIEIELVLRDGKFDPKVWAYAVWFNRADHEGTILKVEGDAAAYKLQIKLKVNKDKWFPSTPGEAMYSVDIKRQGDGYAGTFSGTFEYPGGEGTVKNEVQGKAVGQVFPMWMADAGAYKKLTPADHPRLIFRKSDLPMLRKRMETPEGKAIFDRILSTAKGRGARGTAGKLNAYPAAGLGVAYQLTGDKAYAEQAKAIMEAVMPLRSAGRQDIHYGPYALGSAIAYDCCYDAWEPAFRQKVTDWLAQGVRDLASGTNIGTFAPNPWHNHNGVRIGGCGTAAIALLGEKDADGKEIAGLEGIIHNNARDARRYFEFGGLGASGWCLEGGFYKTMTWNSGPGHLAQAYRSALGGELFAGQPAAWAILGEWMAGGGPSAGGGETAGLPPTALPCVDKALLPGVRYLYDETFGLKGNKTFGFDFAFHGAYVLMCYPFDTPAVEPAKSLPWCAPDPVQGHWIFRKPWTGSNEDMLLVLHNKSQITPGCHYERSGQTCDMSLRALGKQWIGSPRLTESEGGGAALPMLAELHVPMNTVLGARTLHHDVTPDGKAVLSLDMDGPFMEQSKLARGEKPDPSKLAAGQKYAVYPRFGTFIDSGVQVRRYMAIDAGGACGAPLMLAFYDTFKTDKTPIWNLKIAREAGACKVDGQTFTVGDEAGANMKGTFIGRGVTVKPGVSATGAKEFFVVITIQKGAAPAVTAEGEGAKTAVTVGGQKISFDGAKLVLAK
jgi:hypothetical protein